MIVQGFNYADSTLKEMTYLFETRVENLDSKEDIKSSASSKKKKDQKSTKKRKGEAFGFGVV